MLLQLPPKQWTWGFFADIMGRRCGSCPRLRFYPTPNRSGCLLFRLGRPATAAKLFGWRINSGGEVKTPRGMYDTLGEKRTLFARPERRSISGVALPCSGNVGSTTPGLFLTWCRPRPSVGVVFSPDFAGISAFKHGLRGAEGSVHNGPAFLPGFTWVFC